MKRRIMVVEEEKAWAVKYLDREPGQHHIAMRFNKEAVTRAQAVDWAKRQKPLEYVEG